MWCGCRVGMVWCASSLDEGWHLWATIVQALVTPLRSILLSGPVGPPYPPKKSETGCREAQARHRAACGTYIADLARPAALDVARLVRRGSRRQRR